MLHKTDQYIRALNLEWGSKFPFTVNINIMYNLSYYGFTLLERKPKLKSHVTSVYHAGNSWGSLTANSWGGYGYSPPDQCY